MRIIAGKWKGRPLAPFQGAAIRPTSDKVRGAIFSALSSALEARGLAWEDLRVLDLYAGSGALALEALSRGAPEALLVESDPKALSLIAKNAALTGAEDSLLCRRSRVEGWFERPGDEGPFNLVLADPPYGRGEAARVLELISRSARVPPGSLLAVERGSKEGELPVPPGLGRIQIRLYGDTAVEFFEKTKA